MGQASKKHAIQVPEAKSALSRRFEFAMGPGLALAVAIVLGAYLMINDQPAGTLVDLAHQQGPATQPFHPASAELVVAR